MHLNPFANLEFVPPVLVQPHPKKPTWQWPIQNQTTSNRLLPSSQPGSIHTFSPQEESRLLSLPSEIRNDILLYALLPMDDRKWLELHDLKTPGLIFACRQLLIEGLPIFLGRNGFIFPIQRPCHTPGMTEPVTEKTIRWVKSASALRDPSKTLPPIAVRRLAFVVNRKRFTKIAKMRLWARRMRSRWSGDPSLVQEIPRYLYLLIEGAQWEVRHNQDSARQRLRQVLLNWEKYRPGYTPNERHALSIKDVNDLAVVFYNLLWPPETASRISLCKSPFWMGVRGQDFFMSSWDPHKVPQWWHKPNPWPKYLCYPANNETKAMRKVEKNIKLFLGRFNSYSEAKDAEL